MREADNHTPEEIVPRYDMSAEAVQQLTDELLSSRVPNLEERSRFLVIEVDGKSQSANIGRYVERVVFEEKFGNDAAEMTTEYGDYEAASLFFLTIDAENRVPAGALRVITDSPAGLKTFNDVRHAPAFHIDTPSAMKQHSIDNLEDVWDIGTVAVLPEYQRGGGRASIQLYRAMYLGAMQKGIGHLVSIIDDGPYKTLTRGLGIPFGPLAGSKPGSYLGSKKSHVVYGRPPEFFDAMVAHKERMVKHRRWRKLAEGALNQLVYGTKDEDIITLPSDYKN